MADEPRVVNRRDMNGYLLKAKRPARAKKALPAPNDATHAVPTQHVMIAAVVPPKAAARRTRLEQRPFTIRLLRSRGWHSVS